MKILFILLFIFLSCNKDGGPENNPQCITLSEVYTYCQNQDNDCLVQDPSLCNKDNFPYEWDTDLNSTLDNLNDFQNNGSITTIVRNISGDNMVSLGDMIFASVDDNQRGVSIASQVPLDFPINPGSYIFLFMIYSNASSGETLNFQFYDYETDTIYDIYNTQEFESDMIHGDLYTPYTMVANTSQSTEE